jgi:MFS family permease
MTLTQLVMVAVMTMTPVHMHDHGHGTAVSGLVIAIHIGAMYVPSPLTGWLVGRHGCNAIAAASGITLLTAGILAATAPGNSVLVLALALASLALAGTSVSCPALR